MYWLWRFLALLIALGVAAVLAVAGVLAAYGTQWTRDLPDYRSLDSLTLGSTTRVYARDLTQLGTLTPSLSGGARINRTLVELDEISPYMLSAVITNEDRRFFSHYGVDPQGILRGLKRTLNQERVEGGSTLTNQLVKLTLLDEFSGNRISPERKVKEWLLSVQVERAFTKEEILQNYLNLIYWGDGGPVELYGVHAAAKAYFATTPRHLSLAQSVYLTTLVPSPVRYFDYQTQRGYMRSLLNRMVDDGWITRAQADEAWREKLQPKGWKVKYDAEGNVLDAKLVDRTAKYLRAVTTTRAPHFMQQVERELIARFGRERVFGSGGLNVYTTLDPKAQSAAEQASREAKIPPGATLGAVLLDPYTADVLAMVGQKLEGNRPPLDWNNAAQGQRQVGSSIKPLVYTTALSTGKVDQLHTEFDEPTGFPCATCPGGEYKPQNFGGKYAYRDVTIREALDRSLNIPILKLSKDIGLSTLRGKLTELGLNPPRDAGLSLAIGTLETTPLGMAAAYAPFVNGGVWKEPRYITRVTTASGEVLYDVSNERQQQRRVWSPQVAYLGLDMLLGVVNDLDRPQGLAWRARIPGWQVGGKTGTTNDVRDLWFVGVTPMYVGAVWVGKQQNGTMGDRDFSGEVNPPIWRTMMQGALAGKPPREFAVPDGITYKTGPFSKEVAVLDPNFQGAASTQVERDPQVRQYREVNLPPIDPDTVMVNLDRRTGRLATEFTPPEFVVQRRARVDQLPGYAPDPAPAALPEEEPAEKPEARPAPRPDGEYGIPRAPGASEEGN